MGSLILLSGCTSYHKDTGKLPLTKLEVTNDRDENLYDCRLNLYLANYNNLEYKLGNMKPGEKIDTLVDYTMLVRAKLARISYLSYEDYRKKIALMAKTPNEDVIRLFYDNNRTGVAFKYLDFLRKLNSDNYSRSTIFFTINKDDKNKVKEETKKCK